MQMKISIDSKIVSCRLIQRASQYFIEVTTSDNKKVLITIDYKKALLKERTNFVAHIMNNIMFRDEQHMHEVLDNKHIQAMSVELEDNVFARLTQTQIFEEKKVKKSSHAKKK